MYIRYKIDIFTLNTKAIDIMLIIQTMINCASNVNRNYSGESDYILLMHLPHLPVQSNHAEKS